MSDPRTPASSDSAGAGATPDRTAGSTPDRTPDRAAASTPDRTAGDGNRGSLLRAGVIMTVLALLLSWLPLIGPLIAGVVGGREAGTPPRALGVAILPAVILAVLVGWVLAAFELPVLGAIAGFGIFVVIVVELAPMLFGAWFGAAMTRPR